ncbi:hypothetical protein BU15DRAFT_81144 [Melanogaster broomeanus]|nr:hypothetical protein BU15DRAFT_81144 [Melanogaster broomeanus]
MSATSLAAVARDLMQAPLIGTFIALVLYGVTTIQTFFYFQTYPDDHGSLKLMVLSLWTLETIHSGLNISFINHYLIDSFGDVDALLSIPWLGYDSVLPSRGKIASPHVVVSNSQPPPVQFIISFIVLYLAHMAMFVAVPFNLIHALSDALPVTASSWTVAILGMLTIARFALATIAVALSGIYRDSWGDFRDHAYVFLIVCITIGIINDTLMAAILALHLEEGRSGSFRTDRLINRLLAYTVATGAFTAMFNCLSLITLLASKNTLIYLAFGHILMKVYANSALLSLNMRRYQRRSLGRPVDIRTASFNMG